MLIKTQGLKGPFRIISREGILLSTQEHFDYALAYVQGTLDRMAGNDVDAHVVEARFDYRCGHRSKEFSAIHNGAAQYLIGRDDIPDAISILTHCLERSPYRSFVVTIYMNKGHYAFDKQNSRAYEIYSQQRFMANDPEFESP